MAFQKQEQKISIAERRMIWSTRKLSRVRNQMARQDQIDAAFAIKNIQDYGTSFFPNHYIMDDVEKLEAIASKYEIKEHKPKQ